MLRKDDNGNDPIAISFKRRETRMDGGVFCTLSKETRAREGI